MHCEHAGAIHPYALCRECLTDITWIQQNTLCVRCGKVYCICSECRFRGAIKPVFEMDGTLPFLIEASLKKRIRATHAIAQILQGWELIRYVSEFIPLEKKDALLVHPLNSMRNKKTKLEATITHILTRKKQTLLPFTLQNKLLISLVDLR